MKKSFKAIGMMLMAALVGFGMTACSEKEEQPDKQPEKPKVYKTDLKTIKIVNAGAKGDQVVEGQIDSVTSTITFAERLSAKTNFAAIKFEITASEGAKLEQETYDFSMGREETEKEVVLKVVNHDKYKEYLCTIGKVAPLHGADFSKAEVKILGGADFPIKVDDNRWNALDGNYAMLIANKNVQVISTKDIFEGKKAFAPLSLEGVTGWMATTAGEVANGHLYVSNLATSVDGILKIYYYENATAKPEVIFEKKVSDIKGTGRYGDALSMDLDADGNGYIFMQKNGGAALDVLRLTVKNHKEISEPTVIPFEWKGAYTYDTINRIEGTDWFIQSGGQIYPRIVDANLKQVLKFKGVIEKEYSCLRIIEFNKERYLYGITLGRGVSTRKVLVYNITKGKDAKEAIETFFTEKEHKAIFEAVVGDGMNAKSNSTSCAAADYYIEKDAEGYDKALYLLGASKGNGIMVTKVPIKESAE